MALVLTLAACSTPNPPPQRWAVFGSAAELQFDTRTPAETQRRASAAVAAQWQVDEREWHAWQPSALTAFNAALATDGEATLTPSLQTLVERSRPLVSASGGRFDPGSGRLVALWGFHTSDYPINTPAPDAKTLAAWARRPDSLADLACDTQARCRRTGPRLQLDFNAIAEGLALEQAADRLRSLGVTGALLNLGGDVLALGDRDGRAWRVGLDDGEGGVLGGVALADGEALMSSGRYAKFRQSPEGERWPHVLDPVSGLPATHARLSAVLHADPVLADAAATALLVAGPEGFEAVVRGMRLGCALMIDEAGALWITREMDRRFETPRAFERGGRVETGDVCVMAAIPAP